MSNYTKTTNFTAKDNLPTGNPARLLRVLTLILSLMRWLLPLTQKLTQKVQHLQGQLRLAI